MIANDVSSLFALHSVAYKYDMGLCVVSICSSTLHVLAVSRLSDVEFRGRNVMALRSSHM